MNKLFATYVENCRLLLQSTPVTPKWERVCLGLILLGCLAVRLWTIGTPDLKQTIWKEIDYITISQNYLHNGLNFFMPEIAWPAEPPRTTAIEFPIIPYAAALIYKIAGYNVYSVRMLPILSFLLMSFYTYRLVKREWGVTAGLISALVSCIIPLYHRFGRILFSDPFMIAMSTLALYHFAKWLDSGRKWDWILAMFGFSLAVALKLTPLYLLLPLCWSVFRKYKMDLSGYKGFLLLVTSAMILPILWYVQAYHLAKTSMDVFGIFGGMGSEGGHDKFQSLTLLSDLEWYKIMYERISWEILRGKIGMLFFLSGIALSILLKSGGLIWAYLLAIFCHFGIVAEGNIDGSYRQLTIIPPIAGFVALGAIAMVMLGITGLTWIKTFGRRFQKPAFGLLGSIVLILLFAQRNHQDISNPMSQKAPEKWALAQEIKKRATPETKIVVAGEYTIHKGGNDLSPVLYYYADVQGWTLQKEEWRLEYVDRLIQKGATLFAAVKMSREPEAAPFLESVKAKFSVVYEKDDFWLVDLRETP